LDAIYQARIRPFGLKGSMLSILFLVGKNKGIHQKNLAEKLGLDQSTISRDLKKLVEKGWVLVKKGKDARFSELEMSPDGFALLEEVSPVWEETHQEIEGLLGQFSIQQLDSISQAIRSKSK
ncbi:MAG: MarR family winged helix-turn-helix transcriptional regulator, partial [Bacteroidota bacterium]